MSTGYGWEGLRQVCATPLSARHVPERLCGGLIYLGRYNKCSPLPFYLIICLYKEIALQIELEYRFAPLLIVVLLFLLLKLSYYE